MLVCSIRKNKSSRERRIHEWVFCFELKKLLLSIYIKQKGENGETFKIPENAIG